MVAYFNTFMMIHYIEIYKLFKSSISRRLEELYLYGKIWLQECYNHIRGYAHKSKEE